MKTTRLATLFAVAAAFAAAPAAHAMNNTTTGASGDGCHYTDKDGYDIPIDDGQSVIVDGKTVTCTGGTVVVSSLSVSHPKPKPKPRPATVKHLTKARAR